MLAALATARFAELAWRFVRVAALVAFATSCATTIWLTGAADPVNLAHTDWIRAAGIIPVAAALGLVFIAPASGAWPRASRFLCAIGGLGGLAAASGAALCTWADRYPGIPGYSCAPPMVVLAQLLSALLLGTMTAAWLLGHAYLTATRMTIVPLQRISRLLTWVVAARIGMVIFSVLLAWWMSSPAAAGEPAELVHSVLGRLQQSWLIVLLRCGVGLAAVLIFAIMVGDCVRVRATQSATGILYFASVFAYVGELAGQQLIRECGWPI